jgi:ABC-2 type transport system ATP-binding protein
VEAICDRVIIINKGNIVADDTLANLQRGKMEKHVVMVQFGESIDGSLLEQLTGVEKTEALNASRFSLQTSQPDWVRKQLLNLAVEHNLNIISLQTEGHSLEQVFRSLTTSP